MSEDLYIGLSREQINLMLLGKEMTKRPYYKSCRFNKRRKIRYGMYRVHAAILTEKEEAKEPKTAFIGVPSSNSQ